MGIFVDRGYRTGLGISFYDRSVELKLLEEYAVGVKTLVVYGPRGVGKSELVRYYVRRRLGRGARVLWLNAREHRLEEVTGAEHPVNSVIDVLAEVSKAPRSLIHLAERMVKMLMQPSIIVVDELHLMYSDRREALLELEALAGFLAKNADAPKLIVTVSEGFFTTMEAVYRLHGYSVGFMLVEAMRGEAFRLLYSEYVERHGCSIAYEAYSSIAGGLPGYLPELCSRSVRLLEEWLNLEAVRLRSSVEAAGVEAGLEGREVYETAARLLKGEPPRDRREEVFGEKLVEANVAYPCQRGAERLYLPQLPVYLVLLESGLVYRREGLRLEDVITHRIEQPRCREGGV